MKNGDPGMFPNMASVQTAMDRVPFVGARVPAAWARALPLFKAVDPPLFQKLLKRKRRGSETPRERKRERERERGRGCTVFFRALESRAEGLTETRGGRADAGRAGRTAVADKVATHEDVTDAQLAALVSEKLGLEPLRVLFAGVHVLYVAAVRQPSLKASVLKEDLKELKLPAELIPDFAKIVDVRWAARNCALAPLAFADRGPTVPDAGQQKTRHATQARAGAGRGTRQQASLPGLGAAPLARGRGHLHQQSEPRAPADRHASDDPKRRPCASFRGAAVAVSRVAVQRRRRPQGHGQHQPKEYLQDQGLGLVAGAPVRARLAFVFF